MKIKNFIIYSIIYIGIVWIIAFMLSTGSYKLSFFGYGITLPNSIWFIIPIVIFAVLCILDIIYNKFLDFRSRRLIKNDANLYNTLSREVLLGLESNKDFKTDYFKIPSEITKFLSPWKVQDYDKDVLPDNLKSATEIAKNVLDGKYVDLSKIKLPSQNPLFIKNLLNKLDEDPSSFAEILKRKDLSNDVIEKAYISMLKTALFKDIKKYRLPNTKEEIYILVNRYVNDGSEFDIPKDDLYEILKSNQLKSDDYIYFAKKFIDKIEPQNLIAIFTNLKNEQQESSNAYFYLLYELGMLDKLKEELDIGDEKDNLKFRTLIFLRDNGKNIPASFMF